MTVVASNMSAATWPKLIGLVCLILLAAQLPAVGNGFVYDDDFAITHNAVVTEGHFGQVFTSDFWGISEGINSGAYRPLVALTFLLQWQLTPQNAAPFHVVNTLLFLVVVLLGFQLFRRFGGDRLAALAMIGVALHPAFADVAYNIVQRSELMAAAFGLGYLLVLWPRDGRIGGRRVLAGAGLLLAALLSKEHAIMLPFLLLVIWRFAPGETLHWREVFGRLRGVPLLSLAAVGLYFALRIAALGGMARATPFLFNPLVAEPTGWRVANSAWLLVHYLQRFFWPFPQPMEFSYSQLPVFGASEWAVLAFAWLIVGILVGSVGIGLMRRRVVALGLAWFLLLIAPAVQMLVMPNMLAADRVLFLPGMGLLLAVMVFGRALAERLRLPGWLRLIVLCFVGGLLLGQQLTIGQCYRDNPTLFRALAANSPQSANVQLGHGKFEMAQGNLEAALEPLSIAVHIAPFVPNNWQWYGRVLLATGHFPEATKAFAEMTDVTRPEALRRYRVQQVGWVKHLTAEAIAKSAAVVPLFELLLPSAPDDYDLWLGYARALAYHVPQQAPDILTMLKQRFADQPGLTDDLAAVQAILDKNAALKTTDD